MHYSALILLLLVLKYFPLSSLDDSSDKSQTSGVSGNSQFLESPHVYRLGINHAFYAFFIP